MIKMSVEEIKEIIRPCGLSPMKGNPWVITYLDRQAWWKSTTEF
jgi:hypothetical protein